MTFNTLITGRFSVRSYTGQKVDKQLLLEVLEAARLAPSAVNYQPWHFIVITEDEDLKSIHEVYHRHWFREAPAVIVVCADHSMSWKRKSDGKDFADVDAAIAIDHLILKATELNLGTCWVCNFDVEMAVQRLGLPEHIEPIALIPIGYTNATPPVKSRRELSVMVHWGKFEG